MLGFVGFPRCALVLVLLLVTTAKHCIVAWPSVKCLSRGFRDFGLVCFGIFAVSQVLLLPRVFYEHVWFVGLHSSGC